MLVHFEKDFYVFTKKVGLEKKDVLRRNLRKDFGLTAETVERGGGDQTPLQTVRSLLCLKQSQQQPVMTRKYIINGGINKNVKVSKLP